LKQLVVDTGLAFDVLLVLFEVFPDLVGRYREVIKRATEKAADSLFAIPLIRPTQEAVTQVLDYWPEPACLIEFHAGVSLSPYDQLDTEGDPAGSACPTRGRTWLKNLVSKLAGECSGVILDLTDFFVYSPDKGVASCLCENCTKRLKELIGNEIPHFLQNANTRLSSDEVIEEIENGLALKALVPEENEGGYTFIKPPSSARLIDLLADHRIARLAQSFGKRGQSTYDRALASLTLFLRARSRLTGEMLAEALGSLESYKAVCLEGTSMEGATSPLTDEVAPYLNRYGVEIWVHGSAYAGDFRLYNLKRSRYSVNQLNEVVWQAVKMAQDGIFTPRDDLKSKLRHEVLFRWRKLATTVSRSWIPAGLQEVQTLGGKYAVLGWPPEVWEFTKEVVTLLTKNYDFIVSYFQEMREVKSSFYIT